MNLEELDQKILTLKGELTQITTNVLELQALPIFKAAKTWTMTGNTKLKVEPAFALIDRIWEFVPLIQGVLAKADTMRADMPRFMQGAKITEIDNLLTGQSITMPRVAVPLEQRGLLSAAEQKPTQSIDQLKHAMVEAFDEAKKVFFELRDCRRNIDEVLNKLRTDANALKDEVEAMGKPLPAEMSDLLARLSTIEHKRDSDPLAMNQGTGIRASIDPYMLIARQKVSEYQRERENIATDVQRAATKLQDLKTLRVQALENYQGAQNDILNPQGLVTPGSTKEVAASLDDLNKLVAEKKWEAARTGLIAWTRKHDELKNSLTAAVNANKGLVDKRKAILARYSKAKAECELAKKRGLVPDKALNTFESKADELMKGKMDLAAADTIVYSYETRLSEMISRLPK